MYKALSKQCLFVNPKRAQCPYINHKKKCKAQHSGTVRAHESTARTLPSLPYRIVPYRTVPQGTP